MYLDHFHLRETPFKLTPDTGYFFNYASHHEALNVLRVSLREGEGFIKVTGEVGTGKTLLCRMLLTSLGEEYATAYIPNPLLTPQGLHIAFAEELGVPLTKGLSLHHVVKRINQRLIELAGQGRQVVLLVDEAQAIPDDTLEALRLITNLETEKRKLLQVVLFGQTELDRRLEEPDKRQLRQRITFAYRLRPLDLDGTEGYIQHRLAVAGYNGRPLFDKRAVKALFEASGGTPRLINIYCHKALMAAYGRGDHTITPWHIRAAVNDGLTAPGGLRRLLWLGLTLSALLFGVEQQSGLATLAGWLP